MLVHVRVYFADLLLFDITYPEIVVTGGDSDDTGPGWSVEVDGGFVWLRHEERWVNVPLDVDPDISQKGGHQERGAKIPRQHLELEENEMMYLKVDTER